MTGYVVHWSDLLHMPIANPLKACLPYCSLWETHTDPGCYKMQNVHRRCKVQALLGSFHLQIDSCDQQKIPVLSISIYAATHITTAERLKKIAERIGTTRRIDIETGIKLRIVANTAIQPTKLWKLINCSPKK